MIITERSNFTGLTVPWNVERACIGAACSQTGVRFSTSTESESIAIDGDDITCQNIKQIARSILLASNELKIGIKNENINEEGQELEKLEEQKEEKIESKKTEEEQSQGTDGKTLSEAFNDYYGDDEDDEDDDKEKELAVL